MNEEHKFRCRTCSWVETAHFDGEGFVGHSTPTGERHFWGPAQPAPHCPKHGPLELPDGWRLMEDPVRCFPMQSR